MLRREADRREFRRLAVAMRVVEEHSGGRTEAAAIDICEMGMRYVKPANAPRSENREVMLEFWLPGDYAPVRLSGWIASEVVRRGNRLLSVTFAFPTDSDAERVCALLARANAVAQA